MPIRINLLAEHQEQEELRRKNPVKRSLWLAGFVLFLVLLWGLTLFLKIIVAKSEVSGLEAKWKEMEKAVKQVEDARRLQRETERKLSALAQFTSNRFLWANVLNALQQTCVDQTALVRLKAEQTYSHNEPVSPSPRLPLSPPPGANPPVAALAAKTVPAVERIVLHLEGRDFCARPGDQVPRYKEALAGFPLFQAQLQKTNSIRLTSQSAPQSDPVKKTAFVQFGLQLNFQETERSLYE